MERPYYVNKWLTKECKAKFIEGYVKGYWDATHNREARYKAHPKLELYLIKEEMKIKEKQANETGGNLETRSA